LNIYYLGKISEIAVATLGLPVFALRARLGASVMPASKLAVVTLGLPVFCRSSLAADGFPGLAFAVLLVEILEELSGFFGAHLAHLRRLFLRFLATAVGRISLAIA
jgi:hypothetical protein